MRDPLSWAQPRVEWEAPLDLTEAAPSAQPGAELLVTWPATEFEHTDTDCFTLGDQTWIWQPEVGAVRFSLKEPRLWAFRWPGADEDRFRQVVTRSWLPAIYPLWGRQVLHASAVACMATGEVVAFTGPTHAGKSTTAYGVGRRPGWRPICDDTLAFSIDGTGASAVVQLHPIPNDSRLRPASAEFYGVSDRPQETLDWPERHLQLKALYVIEGDEHFEGLAEFSRLRGAEALPLLLQQAYALSFTLPKYNQQLMKDYLALATVLPVFRLRYRRSFDAAEELFSAITGHLATEAGVTCATPHTVNDRPC